MANKNTKRARAKGFPSWKDYLAGTNPDMTGKVITCWPQNGARYKKVYKRIGENKEV